MLHSEILENLNVKPTELCYTDDVVMLSDRRTTKKHQLWKR